MYKSLRVLIYFFFCIQHQHPSSHPTSVPNTNLREARERLSQALRLVKYCGVLPNLIYGVNMNLSIEQLTCINENLSSLWEIVAYADDLSKEEIIKHLKTNLHQLDDIFKCVES